MTNIQYQRSAIDAVACISGGWELIKNNYWIYFGMMALIVVANVVISCLPVVPLLFQIFVMPALTVGVYFAMFKEMRGEPVDFGMMFKGFEKYVPTMLVGLINAIPTIIFTFISFALNLGQMAADIIQQRTGRSVGTFEFAQANDSTAPLLAGGMVAVILIVALIFFIFSIGWGITFFFTLPILAEHDVSAIEAIKLSAAAGWGNVGGLILLFILEFLVVLAGVIAICIGLFFVIPIVFAANAVAYRFVFPMVSQTFNYAPPPPTEYGFGGQS